MSDCVHASLGAGVEYVQYMCSHSPTEMPTAVHSGRMLHIPIHYVHNWQALSTNTYIYIHVHIHIHIHTIYIYIYIYVYINQYVYACLINAAMYSVCMIMRMYVRRPVIYIQYVYVYATAYCWSCYTNLIYCAAVGVRTWAGQHIDMDHVCES